MGCALRAADGGGRPHRGPAGAFNPTWLFATPLLLSGGMTVAGAPEIAAGVTVVYQAADYGPSEGELTASGDFVLVLPRSNGSWTLFLEGSTSPGRAGVSAYFPNANADAASVTDDDGDGTAQVSELHYTFDLAGDQQLVIGLVDTTAWLDASAISNDENLDFVNADFVNNPSIEFPDYTPGAVYSRPAGGGWPRLLLVAAGSAGIGDLDDRSYRGLFDFTADGRGAFLAAEAAWDRPGRNAKAGIWVRTDDHPTADDADAAESNRGIYAVLGYQSDAHSVDVRIGLADDEVSPVNEFVAVAAQWQLQTGVVGAGLARAWLGAGARAGAHATTAELFYRLPLGGGAGHIAPSVQYVENARGIAPGGERKTDALVAGVRFNWSF